MFVDGIFTIGLCRRIVSPQDRFAMLRICHDLFKTTKVSPEAADCAVASTAQAAPQLPHRF